MRLVTALLLLSFYVSICNSQYGYGVTEPSSTTIGYYQPRTRSLSGTPAQEGNNVTNDEYFNLLTLTLLKGFAVWRVKAFNDRVYLERTRRSYWFGDRYFRLDNFYWLDTRDTCAYRMNETQRKDLKYEDGIPIYDIFYQCQRYAEYCCGLDCCRLENLNRRPVQTRNLKYPWSGADHKMLILIVVAPLVLIYLWYN